jgi:hypothetical protein
VFWKFALPVSVSGPGFAVPGAFHTYRWFNAAIPFLWNDPYGLEQDSRCTGRIVCDVRLLHLDTILDSSHHREEEPETHDKPASSTCRAHET